MVLKATVDYAPEIKKTKEQHKIGLESVAASLFVEMLVEFDKSDGNPNNNLTMRRTGLSGVVKIPTTDCNPYDD